jgi:hypothetical protein
MLSSTVDVVHLMFACSRPKAAFPCSCQTLVLRVANTNEIRQHWLSSSRRFVVVVELSLGTVEVSHTEYPVLLLHKAHYRCKERNLTRIGLKASGKDRRFPVLAWAWTEQIMNDGEGRPIDLWRSFQLEFAKAKRTDFNKCIIRSVIFGYQEGIQSVAFLVRFGGAVKNR